jgi:hypothetical protein
MNEVIGSWGSSLLLIYKSASRPVSAGSDVNERIENLSVFDDVVLETRFENETCFF